jgi:hypothetical protein
MKLPPVKVNGFEQLTVRVICETSYVTVQVPVVVCSCWRMTVARSVPKLTCPFVSLRE